MAELDDVTEPEAVHDIRFWLCVSCAQKLNPDLVPGGRRKKRPNKPHAKRGRPVRRG